MDGNNVMGSRPDGWWRNRGRAMQRLVDQLAAYSARAGGEWTVVFDGRPRGLVVAERSSLRVAYARRGGRDAADDRIVEMAGELASRPDAVVYTSDRWLRERLRTLGVRVKGAGALLREISESSSR